MKQVLFANALWLVFIAFWTITYFVQAKSDRSKGGRYPEYVERP